MATGNPFRGGSGSSSTGGSSITGPSRRRPNNNNRRRPHAGRGHNNNGGHGGHGHNGGGGGGALTDPPADGFTDMQFDPLTMTSPGNPSAGFIMPADKYGAGTSYLDTGEGSAAFNDPEFRNQAVWSMLNQSGISNASPGGAQQGQWMQSQIDDMIQEYEGLTMNQNPDLTLENFMYGLPGALTPPAAGVPGGLGGQPGRPPITGGQLGPGGHPGRPPVLGGSLGPGGHPGVRKPNEVVPPVTPSPPYDEAWRQGTFYPALRNMMRQRWAHATPGERGTDLTRYVGPGSTVAF